MIEVESYRIAEKKVKKQLPALVDRSLKVDKRAIALQRARARLAFNKQKAKERKYKLEQSIRAERWAQIRSVLGLLVKDSLFYAVSCFIFGVGGWIGGINFPNAIACDRPDSICARLRWDKDSVVFPKKR